MFFNKEFNAIPIEERIFYAIETISVTLTRYARCKGLDKNDYNSIAANLISNINKDKNRDYGNGIIDVAKKLQKEIGKHRSITKFTEGISLFSVNLFIKKIVPLMSKINRDTLHAPLNKDELKDIEFKRVKNIKRISDISFSNYRDVMADATRYAKGLANKKPSIPGYPTTSFSSLFDWEYLFWNNR